MDDVQKRVEAILFTTGRFLDLEELSQLSEIASKGYLKEVLTNLHAVYHEKDTSLEIIEDHGKWKLSVKKEYLYLTEKLLTSAELDKPVQQTLAVIAYKQPAIQSYVIDVRGNKAYDHIALLKEQGFIISEKYGRTKLLKLAQKFFDYFDVVDEKLTMHLNSVDEVVVLGDDDAKG